MPSRPFYPELMEDLSNWLIAVIITAAIALVPLRPYEPDSFKPRTLAGIYKKLLTTIPSRPDWFRCILLLCVVLGIVTTLFPIVFAAMMSHPGFTHRARGTWFVAAGLTSLLGAVCNGCVIQLNYLYIAFGTPPPQGREVVISVCIAVVQVGIAIAAIVLGIY